VNWRPPADLQGTDEDGDVPQGPVLDPSPRATLPGPSTSGGGPPESGPPHVDRGLRRIQSLLAERPSLLCCLDFDGTLAPIADDPAVPELTEANRAALSSLAATDRVDVAVVSGRSLADVRTRVDVPGVDYAGNHGLELDIDGEESTHPLAAARLPTVRRVRDELAPRLAPLTGCTLEDKRLTLTVHTRGASQADATLARKRTRTVVDAVAGDDLHVSSGKRVLELRPAFPSGKDLAVRLLEEHAGDDTLVVAVGDDTTDEAAFRAVAPDGVSVHVGDGADTAADYRVDGPAGVANVLRWLEAEHH
jgi:trehalose 6-phosphate phosphatase